MLLRKILNVSNISAVMPHFESILNGSVVHQDQTQTKTRKKIILLRGRDEECIAISFKNSQLNATTSLNIIQKGNSSSDSMLLYKERKLWLL